MKPNLDQVLSLVRAVLSILGTMIVAHGTFGINAGVWEQITGVVLMVAPMVWGMYAHTDSAKLASVEAMPEVTKIVVKTTATDGVATAAEDPNRPKVVTTTAPSATANVKL